MANKKSNKIELSNILTCILYVVIGILLCVLRMGLINILLTIVGVLFLAFGIYDVIKKNTTTGIVEIAIGVILIVCGWVIPKWAIIVFGVFIIVKGVLALVDVMKSKKKDTMSLVGAIVTIIIGIALCLGIIGAIGDIICIVVGIIFIVNGILALFGKKL